MKDPPLEGEIEENIKEFPIRLTTGITPRIRIVLVYLFTQFMNEQTNTIKDEVSSVSAYLYVNC